MPKDEKYNLDQKILEIVRKVIKREADLRHQYNVGHKFRFVTDRLNALIHQLEQHTLEKDTIEISKRYELANDEIIVYVHLFNVHGLKLASWQNMLNPSLLYEYSVNRPIYQEKNAIESLINKKANRHQHAYITIAIKKVDVISDQAKDSLGHTIIRIREGSLRFNKFISFTHNNENYNVDDDGNIVKD